MPTGQHMDDIVFLKPVEVGTVVTFTAQILFATTLASAAVVRVIATVENPENGEKSQTNQFHFMFAYPELKRNVHPETYEDAMSFVDGRRRYHRTSNPIF
jgi:acyl-coenzyme A thioesterase 9